MDGRPARLRLNLGPHMTLPDTPVRIEFIQNEREVGPAVRELLRYDLLGFDTETYHSVDRYLGALDPTDGARMRLAQWGTPAGVSYVFDLYRVDKRFLYNFFPNPFLMVGQNLKFEMKFLMYELGIYQFGEIWDTMIAEQIISKGAVAGKGQLPVALDKIAERRLHIELSKDEQKSYWYRNELTDSQIEYAARDSIVVLPIYAVQRDLIVQQDQVRVLELEFDTTPAVANMELNGMKINKNKWVANYENTKVELAKTQDRLWDLLGMQNSLFEGIPTINLNSPAQVMLTFENAGIEIPLDRDGSVTIASPKLAPLTHIESVQLYVNYKKLAKGLSSYGPSWLKAINPFDGRIHGNIKQIGAETGRMSMYAPNLMNIPTEDAYRNCFEAEEGWVFIDADYSQCELRILAEYCRDPNLLEAFDQGYDLHKYSAHLIYKCLLDAVSDIQRAIAKNLNFGIVYGIGVMKFALDSGIPIDEAQLIMDFYLKRAYPLMGKWLEKRARNVLWTMEATTMTGRVRRYVADLKDNEQKAGVQRNAKNLPIQGTNADITKRAMGLLYKKIGGNQDMKMVLPVHDELLVESRPSHVQEGSYILKEAMLKAEQEYLKRVPCVVDVVLTREWCKKPTKAQLQAAQDLLR